MSKEVGGNIMPKTEIQLAVNNDGERVLFQLKDLDGFYCYKVLHVDHPFGEMKKFSAGYAQTSIFLCGCGLRIVIPAENLTPDTLIHKFSIFNLKS